MIYKLIKITNKKLIVKKNNKNEINLKIAMDESTLCYNR